MALDAPENLAAYATNDVSMESIISISKKNDPFNFDKIYSNLLNNQKEGIKFHKSLDFSNVGMPTIDSKSGTNGLKYLRQFHQTRLYIMDYGGMLSHGKENEANTSSTYLISANLPEQFGYEIGSEWVQPFGKFSDNSVNAILQLGGSDLLNQITKSDIGNEFPSTNNRIASIQVWNGSKPLSLSLKIPVIDDGHPNESTTGAGLRTNLVEALEFLGSLCLPKTGMSHLGFYQPPPSPYDFNFQYFEKDKNGNYNSTPSKTFTASGNHVRILLQLGGMLLVDNVILKSVKVEYPNTKTMIRHWYNSGMQVGETGTSYLTPLLAVVTLNITTSEALTANTYSNMLWLKQQTDQGSFNTSNQEMSQIWQKTKTAVAGGRDFFEGIFPNEQTPESNNKTP